MSAALVISAAAGILVISAQAPGLAVIGDRISARVVEGAVALGFGIDQVNLTGQRFVADADVFDALDLGNVRTFWQLDADAALKRIERIAWVDTAQVTRVYPARLDIEIRERKPAALWMRGDAQYLVDATGRVLSPAATTHAWVLPQISGEGANSDAASLIAALARHPEIARRVATSERVADRRWRLRLSNGGLIELAAEREIEGLNQVAQSSALRNALAGEPVSIDVRSAGRVAVRPLGDKVAYVKPVRSPKDP
ncbi:MAG: cell division protein FtsQ/DivIB [Hyphomicrobium sp.]